MLNFMFGLLVVKWLIYRISLCLHYSVTAVVFVKENTGACQCGYCLYLGSEPRFVRRQLMAIFICSCSYVYIIVHIVSEKVGLVYKEMYLDPNM